MLRNFSLIIMNVTHLDWSCWECKRPVSLRHRHRTARQSECEWQLELSLCLHTHASKFSITVQKPVNTVSSVHFLLHSSCQRCRSCAQSSFIRCFLLDEHLWWCVRWRGGVSLCFMNEMKSNLHPSPSTHTHTHTDHSKQTHTHLILKLPHGLWSRHLRTSCVTSDSVSTEAPAPVENTGVSEWVSQLDTHLPADKHTHTHTQQPLLAGHWNYSTAYSTHTSILLSLMS